MIYLFYKENELIKESSFELIKNMNVVKKLILKILIKILIHIMLS